VPSGFCQIASVIAILGSVSGAHFNPAVTLVFAMRGGTPWSEVGPYTLVQCIGGIAGTIVAHLSFDLTPLAIGTTVRSGPSQCLAEAVATFTLVLAILGGLRYVPSGNPVAGRARDYRSLLVHGIDVVRQPGGHARPRVHHVLCGYRNQSRSRFYCRPIDRCSYGPL
jgi:glycerol uptake facilitator-like aquaporin